jgi:hypothetical protein
MQSRASGVQAPRSFLLAGMDKTIRTSFDLAVSSDGVSVCLCRPSAGLHLARAATWFVVLC